MQQEMSRYCYFCCDSVHDNHQLRDLKQNPEQIAYLRVSGSVEDEAEWIRDPSVLVAVLVAEDDVSWLMAWKSLLQFLNGDILQILVNDHNLLFSVNFH